MKLPKIIQIISTQLAKQNAKAIVVGGSVRDHFLQLPIKDYDVEVYGLDSLEDLVSVLEVYGSVNLVGKSFGVLKFSYKGEEYDFSFPRRESKVDSGHRGFDVKVDGYLTFQEAARRRDFSMNALGYDVQSQAFLDPFGGLKDIEVKKLRHIDDATFIEDPLRVYRAVQFSARFGFTLAEETFKRCKQMVAEGMLEELPKERVFAEWKKLLLKSPKPSVGFELMSKLGILERYFPELHALIGVPQSPKWHPEGDVWVHTMMTLDAMAEELGMRSEELGEKEKLRFLFAILCHDLGKTITTTVEYEDGTIKKWQEINKNVSKETYTSTPHSSLLTPHFKIRSIGHECAGIELTKTLMYRLTDEHDFIESLLPLVEHHLKPSQFYEGGAKASAIRRLATKVNIEELVAVAKADFLGRTTEGSLAGVYHAGEWLLKKSRALDVINKPLDCFLHGRDLIALGLKPSPQFKEILDAVYGEQIEGKIVSKEEAMRFVKERYV